MGAGNKPWGLPRHLHFCPRASPAAQSVRPRLWVVSTLLQVSDERLMSMLESINDREGGGSKGPKITIQRRRPAFDDEDDW